MPSAKLLRQLIKSGTEGNFDAFRTVTEQVIQEERAKQHHLLANDLERLLYGRLSSIKGKAKTIVENVPEDKERGLALLQIKEPVRTMEHIVLSDEKPLTA